MPFSGQFLSHPFFSSLNPRFFLNKISNILRFSRIGNILDSALAAEANINKYNGLVTDLLAWIEQQIEKLNDRTFANSLNGVQSNLAEFNHYRLEEKPSKFDEKGAIEVLLFTIQSQMRADNRIPWTPTEGTFSFRQN